MWRALSTIKFDAAQLSRYVESRSPKICKSGGGLTSPTAFLYVYAPPPMSNQERRTMLEGGCFCGAVRYKIDGALGRASACHCSRCRKAFSGASSVYAEIPDGSKFSWVIGEDELTEYIAGKRWGLAFCRICGSTLCGIFDSKVHGVALGTVDGDPGVQIEMHTFVGSKAPWDHIGGTAPQFNEQYPSSDASVGSQMTPNE